jgi:hypothetical protein
MVGVTIGTNDPYNMKTNNAPIHAIRSSASGINNLISKLTRTNDNRQPINAIIMVKNISCGTDGTFKVRFSIS